MSEIDRPDEELEREENIGEHPDASDMDRRIREEAEDIEERENDLSFGKDDDNPLRAAHL